MDLQNKANKQSPLSDGDIIDLYWQRDEKAIKETDLKYKKYLMTIAYNIVKDKEICHECLDDTYLGAWNSIPPERPNVLKAFLTVIMRRAAIKKYNSNGRKRRIPSEMTVSLEELEIFLNDGNATEEEFNARELGRIISCFTRSLSVRRQYIFMSRYYVYDSVKTIAADLGVSMSTVNKELAAIRDELRRKLESEGYNV